MTATATGASRAQTAAHMLRLAIVLPVGRVDLVVPSGANAGDLLGEVRGKAGPMDGLPGVVLVRASGAPLDPDAELGAQGVRDGDLLVALPPDGSTDQDPDEDQTGRRRAHRRAGPVRPDVPVETAVLPGALALTGVAAGFAAGGDVLQRAGVAAAVLLAAFVVAVAPLRRLLPAGSEVFAPAFAAAAVVALLPRAEPGADLLAVVAAGVVAAQAAALARMFATEAAQAALLVWMWSGAVVAGIGALVLVGDGSPRVVWAAVIGLAVIAVRLLPAVVVDVPDEQLIDTEGMSNTTWSVRGFAPARRRRIRAAQTEDTVLAARGLLDAGALLAAALVAAGAVALAVDPAPGWPRWLAFATGGLAGAALLLGSRVYAGGVPRLALRVGGLVAMGAGAGGALAASSAAALAAIAAGCVFVALVVLLAAVALGNAWRSVWWGRLGDIADGAAVALLFPAATLAAGAFDHLRKLFS